MSIGNFHEKCPLWVVRLFPFIRWWHRVDGQNLRHDLIAGLTGAVVVLPQGVAFATIAGMPPEYGLYAGMIPAVIAALYGSSWHLVSGPTTAASIVLFSSLSTLAEPGSAKYVSLALTLTFMVGVIELILGFARLGTLVNFISHSVVIGFTAGAALLIAASQFKSFLGLNLPATAHFYQTIWGVLAHLDEAKWAVIAVGTVTIITGITCKRYWPKVPYMIVAMLVGSVVSVFMNSIWGQAVTGIKTVGALPQSLPPLSSPEFSLATIKELAPVALAATLFALTEAVSIARAMAARSGQALDGNQEFIGQGLSNLAGSFFSGYVATGSFNRSGLNYQAGAKTPLAAVFAGVFLLVVVLFVAPYAVYLPNAAMAGILFMVAWGLVDTHHIKQVIQTSRAEAGVLIITFVCTLVLDLAFAILFGVMLSLAMYLNRTAHPRVLTRVPDPMSPRRKFTSSSYLSECPQAKIIRIDGSLFFGAVSHVQERLRLIDLQHPEQKHLAIVASGINFIDLQGAEYLAEEARRRKNAGGGMYLIRVKEAVCELMRTGGYLKTIGDENIFPGKTQALAAIFEKLDKKICATCTRRIFLECQSLPPPVSPGEGSAINTGAGEKTAKNLV